MPVEITINKKLVTYLIISSAIFIIIAGVGREIFLALYGEHTFLKGIRIVNLDAENSLPAWFSSFLLLLCSVQLAFITKAKSQKNESFVKHWAFLAIFFFLMSIDESASIHELVVRPLRNAFDLGGIFYFSWVIPAFFVVVAIAIAYIPFFLHLPRKTALLFILAGGLYVGGALGIELVGGYFAEKYGEHHPVYILAAVIEETFEITGLLIFFATLFSLMASLTREWKVKITS
jgi:hypothetical protein